MTEIEAIKARLDAREHCHDFTGCEKDFDLVYLCTVHYQPQQMQDDIDDLLSELAKFKRVGDMLYVRIDEG